MPVTDTILEVKRRWIALDAENDKRGKIQLLRSLHNESPEFAAVCELMIGLHFTSGAYQDIGTFQRWEGVR